MDEPTIHLDSSAATTVHSDPPDNQYIVQGRDHLMGGVTVQVECADESEAAVIDKTTNIENLARNFLAAEHIESAVSSLSGDLELSGSLTPTPSNTDQPTTPTMENPSEERVATCGIRGGEVAKLEELHTSIYNTSMFSTHINTLHRVGRAMSHAW